MPSDNSIHDMIIQRFASDLSDASRVKILVHDGGVALSGEVPRYLDKCAANDAVQSLVGVTSLTDDLKVTTDGLGTDDATLRKAAEHVLEASVFIPSTTISVSAADGCVTLGGTVLYYREKIDAENAIRRLPGLKSIENIIAVSNPAAPRGFNESIINDAIASIPGIAFGAISVAIKGSRAVLDGSVSTLKERKDVEQAAWSAPGITEVENNIVIRARS